MMVNSAPDLISPILKNIMCLKEQIYLWVSKMTFFIFWLDYPFKAPYCDCVHFGKILVKKIMLQ